MSRQQQFISDARAKAKTLWETYLELKAMQEEWDALDYTNTLPDGTELNDGYTKAEVSAVINTTIDAITTLMGQGHATNIAKLL